MFLLPPVEPELVLSCSFNGEGSGDSPAKSCKRSRKALDRQALDGAVAAAAVEDEKEDEDGAAAPRTRSSLPNMACRARRMGPPPLGADVPLPEASDPVAEAVEVTEAAEAAEVADLC